MINILALDTCTEMCSVALLNHNQLYEQSIITQRGHSESVLAMIDNLFQQSASAIEDIDLVAFGRGPGSFTGVRIGVGVAQGIAFARQLPMIPISTLAAVAQRAIDEFGAKQIAVALDARMGEVYVGHYQEENGLAVLIDHEKVCRPEQFKPVNQNACFAAGTGWAVHGEALKAAFADQLSGEGTNLLPTAAAMMKLARNLAEKGQTIRPELAVPVYLRDNVAKKKGEQ